MSREYRDLSEQKYRAQLKKLKNQLPKFCTGYFDSKHNKEIRTLLGYAWDQKVFFTYMLSKILHNRYETIAEITINDMENLRTEDIDGYISHIKGYEKEDGTYIKTSESSQARKQSSLRELIKYLHVRNYITHRPTDTVEQVKIHKKEITTLTETEKEMMFRVINEGYGLEGKRLAHQQRNALRDNAILMVLLGTGIRISELVGLDLTDIDMKENKITVIRKGGNEGHVFFTDQVKKALTRYLGNGDRTRSSYNPGEDEKAVFLSKRHTRLSVRTIEKMIKDYAKIAVTDPNKKVTPHKMRSTFGTELYNRKKDIRLVQAALGHESIVTTSRTYVKFDDNIQKEAAFDVLPDKK